MRACIVDDDYTSRELISDFLEDMGWIVVRFTHPNKDSEQSNNTLTQELSNPDTRLLVMDVRFGRDENGLRQGLNKVKELAQNNVIRQSCWVVFVSQFGKEAIGFDAVGKILNQRMIKFKWLDKPVDFVELSEITSNISD